MRKKLFKLFAAIGGTLIFGGIGFIIFTAMLTDANLLSFGRMVLHGIAGSVAMVFGIGCLWIAEEVDRWRR